MAASSFQGQELSKQDSAQQKKHTRTIPAVKMTKKLTETEIRQYRSTGFNMKLLGMEGLFFKYSMDTFSLFAISSGPSQVKFAKQCCDNQLRTHNVQLTTVIQSRTTQATQPAPPATSPGFATVLAFRIDDSPSKNMNMLFQKLESMCAERKDRFLVCLGHAPESLPQSYKMTS